MSGSVSLVNNNSNVNLVNGPTMLTKPPSPTTLTWVGGGSNAASNPSDWAPAAAPVAGDTLNMSSGTINITDKDLAGNALNFVAPTSGTPVFQNTVNLANGSASFTDGSVGNDAFSLTTGDSIAAFFAGGGGVGFNSSMSLSPNGVTTFTGKANFLYGLVINPNGNNGSILVNDGAIGLTNATLNVNLAGNGTYNLTRYHDGPGTVEINGSVAAGETFTLNGAASFQSTLTIDQPAAFDAAVTVPATSPEGSPGHDTINLEGLTATSYTLTNGVFTLFNGSSTVDSMNLTTALPLTVDQDKGSVGLYFGQSDPSMSATAIPMGDPSSVLPNPPFIPPVTPANFDITDTTTGQSGTSAGEVYSGPVPGLTNDIIIATADNINVDPTIPNTFIHTGSGNDSIDVSGVNGNNVLDGSTGTNFLTGGRGNDTFYVDARNLTHDVFDTINGFHGGDAATIWGIPNGMQPTTGNNVVSGASGVDFAWVLGGHDVNLNIPNYSTTDLSNGRLSMSFGTSPTFDGTPGSPYMLIQANS